MFWLKVTPDAATCVPFSGCSSKEKIEQAAVLTSDLIIVFDDLEVTEVLDN